MVDLDELRNAQLRVHGLTGTDQVYTFYHDETNNIRKLHVDGQGLNVARLSVFVLGGVLHDGPPRSIDVAPLREALRIQKSAGEIKLRLVAKGEFLQLIESPKLTIFLRWLQENGLVVHYHDLDPLYWSVVDIIDSILMESKNAALIQHHALLKSDLTSVLREALPDTVTLFHRHGYPGLAPERRKPFLQELIALVDRAGGILSVQHAGILKSVLKSGQRLDELAFIEGYPPHMLIEDFAAFYINRIALFNRSHHILDMEDYIRSQIEQLAPQSGGETASHFRFADSKAEAGIQLSDIIVGLIGKMLTFLTETDEGEVTPARERLGRAGQENAGLLRDLIAAAHETNRAFLHHVASLHDQDKLDRFLRFRDGKYA